MAWTYSGDPTASNKDAVRFEIGDTDTNDQLLTDEEIVYALSVESRIYGAAARCCEALARKFARQADFTLGPQHVAASQRSEAFARLGRDLKSRIASSAPPYMGGPEDVDGPAFKRDLMSYRSGRCE